MENSGKQRFLDVYGVEPDYTKVGSVKSSWCTRPIGSRGCCIGTTGACCLLVLAALLIGLYVGAPAMAKGAVDKSEITVTYMQVLDAASPAEAEKQARILMKGVIRNHCAIGGVIKPSVAQMYRRSELVGSMQMDALPVVASGETLFNMIATLEFAGVSDNDAHPARRSLLMQPIGEAVLSASAKRHLVPSTLPPHMRAAVGNRTTLPPTDARGRTGYDAFHDFVHDLFVSESAELRMTSEVDLEVAFGTFHKLKLDKAIPVSGLAGLRGAITVNKLNIALGDPMTLTVNATMRNPSALVQHVGRLGIDMQYEQNEVGTLLLDDFTMRRGDNSMMANGVFSNASMLAISAVFDPSVKGASPQLVQLFTAYLGGGNQSWPIQLVSFTVAPTRPSWLSDGMATLNVTTELPPPPPST